MQRTIPDKLRHFIIDLDDPRIGLRGSYGVCANKPIRYGEVLCEYIGELMSLEQFDNRYDHPYHWAQAQRYLCGIDDTIIDTDTISEAERKKLELCVSAYGCGNISELINDCRLDTSKHLSDTNMYKPINSALVEYKTKETGVYRVFVLAVKDIEPGEELLLDYGNSYWEDISNEEKMLALINPLMDGLLQMIGPAPKIIEIR